MITDESENIIKLNIGEELDMSLLPENHCFKLLSGQIRVLKLTDFGNKKTIALLNKDESWDNSNNVFIFIASTNAEVAITEQKENLMNFIEHEVTPINRTENIDTIEPKIENDLAPKELIREIFNYFHIKNDGNESVKNLKDVFKILKPKNLMMKEEVLNWPQLLNTDYPFIFRSNNDLYKWVTGRRGNSLLETKENAEKRFFPDEGELDTLYSVIKVKKVNTLNDLKIKTPLSFWWYFDQLKDHKLLAFQMILSSVLVQFFTLGIPVFYMVIFDRVFGRQNISTLNVIGIGMLIIFALDLAVKSLRSYILSTLLDSIDKRSYETVLNYVLKISWANLPKEVFRNFNSKFSELSRINQTIAYTILISSLDVIFSTLVVSALMFLNWQLAMITLAPLLPIGLFIFVVSPIQKKRAMQSIKIQKEGLMRFSEIVDNAETIKSLNAESYIADKTLQDINKGIDEDFDTKYDRISGGNFIGFISGLGYLAFLYFGAHAVLEGKASFGVYLAISILGRNFISVIQRLLTSIQQFQESVGTLNQLSELFRQELEDDNVQKLCFRRVRGQISLRDLCFKYANDQPPVINNVNFEIGPGQKVVVTGKNGSGKTTFLKMIQRLCIPTSGYVCLDGLNVAEIDINELRSYIGIVLQRPSIFSGTIKDNLILGAPQASIESILCVSAMIELDKFLREMPKGLDTEITAMGLNLPRSVVSQISLARVLLTNPDVLVVDKIFSDSERSLEEAVLSRILRQFVNKTCILVNNNLAIHQQVDKIIVLNNGQIVEAGSFNELMRQRGYYYSLYDYSSITKA